MPSVQKKMNELEVGLLHLQQNIEIPEISLQVNQVIQSVVRKAKETGKKPSVEDLGANANDSSFLNALQKDVSRWIREIQKVCVCVRVHVHVRVCVCVCMRACVCGHPFAHSCIPVELLHHIIPTWSV